VKYPKIQTLYNRDTDGNYGVIVDQLRRQEFGLINKWLITEKVDGRNHRVILHPDGTVEHRGRTDRAHFADFERDAYERLVDADLLRSVIWQDDAGRWPEAVVYGELYGPKIQGGGKYRGDIDLRIFDVCIGDWWLNWKNVVDIAQELRLATVPALNLTSRLPTSKDDVLLHFRGSRSSFVALDEGVPPEGIVARTNPLLFDRRGKRVMWKLKLRDFR